LNERELRIWVDNGLGLAGYEGVGRGIRVVVRGGGVLGEDLVVQGRPGQEMRQGEWECE
jgi:hypothetical protein